MEDYTLPEIITEPVSRRDHLKFLCTLANAVIRDLLKPGPRLSNEEYLRQMNEVLGSGSQDNEVDKVPKGS